MQGTRVLKVAVDEVSRRLEHMKVAISWNSGGRKLRQKSSRIFLTVKKRIVKYKGSTAMAKLLADYPQLVPLWVMNQLLDKLQFDHFLFFYRTVNHKRSSPIYNQPSALL